MIALISRFLFMVAGAMGGLAVSQLIDWKSQVPGLEGLPSFYVIFVFIILGWSLGYLIGGIVGRELSSAWGKAERRLSELSPSDILLGVAGLISGLVAAVLFSLPLRLLRPTWLAVGSSLALLLLGAYAGIRIVMIKRREFSGTLFGRANAAALPSSSSPDIVLDTSAVIDGRFLQLRESGFLEGHLRVPRFVLAELQALADSADEERRARGRRGLDLLATLDPSQISAFEVDYPDVPAVDDKLMKLASESESRMLTVDYNLTKVARVRGIAVLNVNELASAVRPNFLPGERIHLRVAKLGKEPDQGVGYLEDGTMVVVQRANDRVGEEIDVEVTSVLQTSAGRMIFARLGSTGAAA